MSKSVVRVELPASAARELIAKFEADPVKFKQYFAEIGFDVEAVQIVCEAKKQLGE